MRKQMLSILSGKARFDLLREENRRYRTTQDRLDIEKFQTERFNKIWTYCIREVPFYSFWQDTHGLPDKLSSIHELEFFPPLTKTDLRKHKDLVALTKGIVDYYTTGGSSGEPIRIPRGAGEADRIYAGIFAGRGWNGIEPGDTYVHIWGHAHLLGKGRRALLAKFSRDVKDWVAGGTRLNAYVQDVNVAVEYLEIIARKRPKYLIGYTSSLVWLADSARKLGIDNSAFPGIEAAIVTGESVTDRDIEVIESVLARHVIIEYGAAETGVIAYSRGSDSQLHVLWQNNVVTADSASEAQVTTIYPRIFPVIKYRLGDVLDTLGTDKNLLQIEGVAGREGDVLELANVDGGVARLQVRVFRQILLRVPEVLQVQFVVEPRGGLRVLLRTTSPVDLESIRSYTLSELQKVAGSIDGSAIILEYSDKIFKTLAGKFSAIVSYEEWSRG
ncbi:phenylacetate--CoA ligase family protein [Rhodococcus rhodochrous]|uniref:hypothetical protein n=1 Tax=Rhodococcus rhodochrous TaxID=1829 RepID=UPI001784E9C0|nr:hypothetical protein [Rhodococcus rhodochrous]QOH58095.1 hypothetical protein C6Y44_20585 [Rhodococcus rhodochrous]